MVASFRGPHLERSNAERLPGERKEGVPKTYHEMGRCLAVRRMTERSRRSLICLPPSGLSSAGAAGSTGAFCNISHSLTHKRTSWHLLHEDLDVAILWNRAQILNNVPVLQVLVEGDFFMEGLRVPKFQEKQATDWFIHHSRSIKKTKESWLTYLLSLSGISLMAIRTWLLRSLPAYTTP